MYELSTDDRGRWIIKRLTPFKVIAWFPADCSQYAEVCRAALEHSPPSPTEGLGQPKEGAGDGE